MTTMTKKASLTSKKSRKKDKKKDKKKKKKKKEKKHKKTKSEPEAKDSDVKKLLEVAKKMRETYKDWSPISKKDYYNKSTEFRVWLQGKKKYLDDLATEDSKKYFDKFVSKWNAGSLPSKIYKGINRTEVDASALTRHKWSFVKKLGEKEKFQLARLRDDVDTDNQRASFQANALTRTCDIPTKSRGVTVGRPKETAYEREMRYKAEKKSKKDYRKHKEMVMEELVPKATGREALIEKRKQKGAYARAQDTGGMVAMSDSQLMGSSGSSEFQQAIARRNQWRAKKAAQRSARADAAREKEKERMRQFVASMGMQNKYKI